MRKIDKLLKEGHEIVLNTDNVDRVVPLLEYLETQGTRWVSGARLVKHYVEQLTIADDVYFTKIKKDLIGIPVCYRNFTRGEFSPEELMRPVGLDLKRGEML